MSLDSPTLAGGRRVDRFLRLMTDRGASDLHLSVGRPPMLRSSGRLEPVRYRTIDEADFTDLLSAVTPEDQWARYTESGDADFAYEVEGLARFRVNLSRQQRGGCAVFRIIPARIMSFELLGLPSALRRVTSLRSGLFLVTGPTGSGKSTTLAAIIREIHLARPLHFVTLEDPIEFVYERGAGLMSQREIGRHSESFEIALRAAIREDPDAILVGELRDAETIRLALEAAELGVLVFGTLHTNSAARTVDRILGVFPADQQDGARNTLAAVLRGVVAQQLVPRIGGGRVAAIEILFHLPALSSLIREGKTHQIPGLIQVGRKIGMVGMDDALKTLIERGQITPAAAIDKAIDKDALRTWLSGRGASA
jgi:twitching motility protein PilT